MKTVTKYKADDGVEFNSVVDCMRYEEHCAEVADAMKNLPDPHLRGKDSKQWDDGTVITAQRRLVAIFERYHPGMKDAHTQWALTAEVPAAHTLIGRYVDDAGTKAERSAWSRLARMDSRFREYEQPYYAVQADRARGVT